VPFTCRAIVTVLARAVTGRRQGAGSSPGSIRAPGVWPFFAPWLRTLTYRPPRTPAAAGRDAAEELRREAYRPRCRAAHEGPVSDRRLIVHRVAHPPAGRSRRRITVPAPAAARDGPRRAAGWLVVQRGRGMADGVSRAAYGLDTSPTPGARAWPSGRAAGALGVDDGPGLGPPHRRSHRPSARRRSRRRATGGWRVMRRSFGRPRRSPLALQCRLAYVVPLGRARPRHRTAGAAWAFGPAYGAASAWHGGSYASWRTGGRGGW